jgi:hypothetical protein
MHSADVLSEGLATLSRWTTVMGGGCDLRVLDSVATLVLSLFCLFTSVVIVLAILRSHLSGELINVRSNFTYRVQDEIMNH